MELQSEEHSWGSSSNEPSFSSAFFLTKGKMLFVSHGLWQIGVILASRKRLSGLPEASVLLSHSFLPLVSY